MLGKAPNIHSPYRLHQPPRARDIMRDWLISNGFFDIDNYVIRFTKIKKRKKSINITWVRELTVKKNKNQILLALPFIPKNPREVIYPLMFIIPYSLLVEKQDDFFTLSFTKKKQYVSGELAQYQVLIPGLTIPETCQDYQDYTKLEAYD